MLDPRAVDAQPGGPGAASGPVTPAAAGAAGSPPAGTTGSPPARDRHAVETGLEGLRLAHRALPGRDLDDMSLRTRLLGAELEAPLLVAARGEAPAPAREATEHGLGLVLRRGEELLDDPDRISAYRTPDRPLLVLGALGLTRLRDADGPERAERLVSLLDADGLIIDIDSLEHARAAGPSPARGATETLAAVADRLAPLPLVARGGGFGVDAADVRELRAAGVAAVDVGGTHGGLPPVDGDPFAGWGVRTAEAVAEAALAAGGLFVIASGGLQDGVDVAKCLALGADAASVAVAAGSVAALVHQLRVAVWATGEQSPAALTEGHLRVT